MKKSSSDYAEQPSRFKRKIEGPAKASLTGALIAIFSLSGAGCSSIKGIPSVTQNEQTAELAPKFVKELPPQSLEAIVTKSEQDTFKNRDIAHIKVYNVEALSGDFTVDGLGNIHLPLIGGVAVSGITTAQLQQTLEQKYGEQYLQNPNVSVSIEKVEIGKIVIDGAVESPGVFEVFETVYLSEAIALAGGLTDDANLKDLYVSRETNGVRQVQQVNLEAIRQYGADDVIIYPYDIVFVQDSKLRVAYNEFLRTVPLLSAAIYAVSR